MNGIRLLPGMKFMSGGVLYRPGDILPDTEETRALAKQGKAQIFEGPANLPDGGKATEAVFEGYEIQSARTLADLTKERGIELPKGINKAGIIELLEAWDADHAEDGDNEGDA
jgi:hypothetical protein